MAAELPRKIGLIDVMVLIAAMAVGALSIRPFLLYGLGMLDLFEEFFPAYRFVAYPHVVLRAVEPWLASLTVAALIVRFRRPRPRLSRLVRQPGTAACLAAVAIMAASGVAGLAGLATPGFPRVEADALINQVFELFFSPVGAVVAAVWLIMGLARIRRREPGWIDRLGRFLGWCWIAAFLAHVWFSFAWVALEVQFLRPTMPVPPFPAQTVTIEQEMRIAEEEAFRLEQGLREAQQEHERLEEEYQILMRQKQEYLQQEQGESNAPKDR